MRTQPSCLQVFSSVLDCLFVSSQRHGKNNANKQKSGAGKKVPSQSVPLERSRDARESHPLAKRPHGLTKTPRPPSTVTAAEAAAQGRRAEPPDLRARLATRIPRKPQAKLNSSQEAGLGRKGGRG